MKEETHDEFMARIRAMSSATYKSNTVRAAIVGAVSSAPRIEAGVRHQQKLAVNRIRNRETPQAAMAKRLAAQGYGFEDIAVRCDLTPEEARRVLFPKKAAWNAWMFGKRGVRA